MTDRPTPYLDGLNPDQFQAATHLDGPSILVAGAGSGKTRTVVARVQCLVDWYRVPPSQILCMTFTRRAAGEMKERITANLPEEEAKDIQVRTFHSTGVRICRSYAHLLGIRDRVSIWDEKAAKRQIKIATQETWEDSSDPERKRSYTPATVLDFIASWKGEGLELDDDFWSRLTGDQALEDNYGCEVPLIKKMAERDTTDKLQEDLNELARIAQSYEGMKRQVGAVDLNDLIWLPVVMARHDQGLRRSLADRWSYLIVDEYQDTNKLQDEFLGLLTSQHGNVMVVGDDDQAIYGWRGSDVKLITTFEERHNATVYRLGQNYRCRPEIVRAAEASIRCNQSRVSKKLWSERDSGGMVTESPHIYEAAEIEQVAIRIEDMISSGKFKRSEIAALTRRRAWVSRLNNELVSKGIPVDAVGVKPWFEQGDVRRVLDIIRYIVNPLDVDAAQSVLSDWPKVGVKTIALWYGHFRHGDDGFGLPLDKIYSMPRHGRTTVKGLSLQRLQDMVFQVAAQAENQEPIVELVGAILDATGIPEEIREQQNGSLKESKEADYRDRAVNAMVEASKCPHEGLAGLSGFLDDIATLISDQQIDKDRVTISTIHGAKGLEWPVVYLFGCSETILPTGDSIEEERRLFYVGSTRAKEQLHYSYSVRVYSYTSGLIDVKRSRFLAETDAGRGEALPWDDFTDFSATTTPQIVDDWGDDVEPF